MLGVSILSAVWKAAIKYLGLLTCSALPLSTSSSLPLVDSLRFVYQESYVIVYLFSIDSLNITWVLLWGINTGT